LMPGVGRQNGFVSMSAHRTAKHAAATRINMSVVRRSLMCESYLRRLNVALSARASYLFR
jgi:hypothetical protein